MAAPGAGALRRGDGFRQNAAPLEGNGDAPGATASDPDTAWRPGAYAISMVAPLAPPRR